MNILLLSVGTRNKIVQYFREALKGSGTVVAVDADPMSAALEEADKAYVVPPITDPGYIECILEICEREKITGALSLIDPELSLLAKYAERFTERGVTVIGSSFALCELAYDKFRMFQWMTAHGYRCARTWVDKERFYQAAASGAVSYPVFMKPVKGSAAVDTYSAYDRETVECIWAHKKDMMIQEQLDGQEIGADVYIDLISGETVSVFTKKKLKMRAGETDRAVSFKDEKLFELIEGFVTETGYRGAIDMDLFEINGMYYISDVNPRFGGGYPHAHESGCDHIRMILENLRGNRNEKHIGSYEEHIFMKKYCEVSITRGDGTAVAIAAK